MPHLPPTGIAGWGLDQSHDLIPLPLGMFIWSNPLVQHGGYVGIRPALYHTIAISSWFHCSEKITSTESLYKYVLTLTAISLLLYRTHSLLKVPFLFYFNMLCFLFIIIFFSLISLLISQRLENTNYFLLIPIDLLNQMNIQ